MVDVLVGLLAFAVVMILYGLLGRSGHPLDEGGFGVEAEPYAEAPLPKEDAAA
jgi:hypothetical protein